MTSTAWRTRYREAIDLLETRLVASPGKAATGFTSNLDLVVPLTTELIARLNDGFDVPSGGQAITRPANPEQLMTGVIQRMAAGEGFDFPISAATEAWLRARVKGELRLGGNGAIAANALSMLGWPCLLHLTSRSADMIGVFDRSEAVMTPGAGIHRLAMVADRSDPAPLHVILEYQEGLEFQIAGRRIVTPTANRIIIAHDPRNSTFRVDPAFVDAVSNPANQIDRVLISGYTQVTSRDVLERAAGETLDAIGRWRASRPDVLIHLELGAMPDPGDLAYLIETLGPEIDSVGMSLEELRDLAAWGGTPVPRAGQEIVSALLVVKKHGRTRRVVVHAAEFALAHSDRDPTAELPTLLIASAVASTRASTGCYPELPALRSILDDCEPGQDGLQMLDVLGMADGVRQHANGWFTAVPALQIGTPLVNVGLGDCFTAGLLAMS